MSVPSGTASLSDIQTEFGGSNPISLSEYYGLVSSPSGIPTSGNPLSIDAFRGKDNVYTLTADYFTSSITLTADDINGSGAAWVGVSGGGGGGAGVVYASSSGFGSIGSGAGGGSGGIHGLFLSDVTDLIGASFVAGSGGGGSTTSGTPGSSGISNRGSTGGGSTFSYGSVTAGGGGGGLGGNGPSPQPYPNRDPGAQGADTGIDIPSSILSYYSGKVITGPQGALRGAAGSAGAKVFSGGGNTPGTSLGGAGGSGNLTIIYEAVPQVT